MSVVVCRSSTPLFHVEPAVPAGSPPPLPYVHPLVRRSSGLMTQQSLEMCTEGLGSETGSDDFSDDDDRGRFSSSSDIEEEEEKDEEVLEVTVKQELSTVNYHSSTIKRSIRSFPPPLPSIARRDGSCIQMRPHRQNGRLVVEAVPVASHNYLHARRHNGRLLLSFIDAATTFHQPPTAIIEEEKPQQELAAIQVKEQFEEAEAEDEEEEEEEEEEVEVVDRGAMVEVKVTSQPQQPGGAMKVLRSSLFINKFVSGTPLTNQNRWPEPAVPAVYLIGKENNAPLQRRPAPTTTTAAAAAVAASSASASSDMVGQRPDNKLLFTSKRRNREELLHHMRRCSELRRPLFFWEPGCIATTT